MAHFKRRIATVLISIIALYIVSKYVAPALNINFSFNFGDAQSFIMIFLIVEIADIVYKKAENNNWFKK